MHTTVYNLSAASPSFLGTPTGFPVPTFVIDRYLWMSLLAPSLSKCSWSDHNSSGETCNWNCSSLQRTRMAECGLTSDTNIPRLCVGTSHASTIITDRSFGWPGTTPEKRPSTFSVPEFTGELYSVYICWVGPLYRRQVGDKQSRYNLSWHREVIGH